MNVEFSLIDKDTGKIIYIGKATHYSCLTDEYGSKFVSVEGVIYETKHFSTILPQHVPDQLDSCKHKWKNYYGLNETYEICDMCGVNK